LVVLKSTVFIFGASFNKKTISKFWRTLMVYKLLVVMAQNYKGKSVSPKFTDIKPKEFIGSYTPTGGEYYKNDTSGILLKVCYRNTESAIKPRKYIMQRHEGGFLFLSSLYPKKDSSLFIAEINRVYYNVTISDGSLIVEQEQTPYVYQ